MAVTDVATVLGNALKVSTPLPIQQSIIKRTTFYDLFRSVTGNSGRRQGRRTEQMIQFGGGESVGARFEREPAPVPGTSIQELAVYVWKKNMATINVTWEAMEEAVEGPTAFASLLQLEITPRVNAMADDLNRQSIGFGAGPVCRISDNWTPGNNPVLIDRAYGLGTDDVNGWIAGIRRGMTMVAGPLLAGGSLRNGGQSVRVLSVNLASNGGAGAFTIDGVVPTEWGIDDYLWKGDDQANNAPLNGVEKEMMGARGFFDDGTLVSTLQNIDRTNYPDFCGFVLDGSAAPYSGAANSKLLMRLHDEVRIRSQRTVTHMLTTPGVYRNAFGVIRGEGGFGAQQNVGGTVQSGAKGITSNAFGGPPVEVRNVPEWIPGTALACDAGTLVRFGMETPEWDDHGGFWKPGTTGGFRVDEWWNILRMRGQLGCIDPRAGVWVTGLLETDA